MRSSLNTTTGSLKSGHGMGASVNMSKQSMNLTSSMSLPVYSTEFEDEVGNFIPAFVTLGFIPDGTILDLSKLIVSAEDAPFAKLSQVLTLYLICQFWALPI